MLLRVRVSLPDRPGSLGQVARTLGVAGADIVQVMVLERVAGRAVDDLTVSWPGAAPLDRLSSGLAAIGGVRVVGLWRAVGPPVVGGCDAELLGQIAANPEDGIATLVDAAPGLLAADWSAALVVPADWARRSGGLEPARRSRSSEASDAAGFTAPTVAYASLHAPDPPQVPDVLPLRARAINGGDGTRYAAAPFGRAGLVLLVARRPAATPEPGGAPYHWIAPAFHSTELDRIAQLVRAAALILREQLAIAATPAGIGGRL
jgi:hypothetical protein